MVIAGTAEARIASRERSFGNSRGLKRVVLLLSSIKAHAEHSSVYSCSGVLHGPFFCEKQAVNLFL